ncbi:C2H2 finger domain-containing protein, variant [Blastomyces dermatitidis ER-3]|uniref:C2H2 finger domain-containing protein, variant n=1 Tax=Ajellomyces dermatitidis (strain ER-3 / ATCC MYA-2586) TaxID=559297 RepID=A0ABX2VVQ1_AJEDR|nr:C2H2 finger domain-containing protein, variant [Blastomyces dermatitidis ER-3]OAT01240.1 C2H2 finger domain-containing protein, variant [Blastomyces dermatitidis ER-3]
MSYPGFGYSPYQYLSGGQNAQPSYNSLPQIQVTSASETPNTQQTANRSYGQQSYEWQGQNNTDISGQTPQQQPERESWQSSTNPSSQSYRYQHQQQSSYSTSNAAPSISSSLSSQQAQQSQQTHNPLISPTLKNIQYGSPTVESMAMHNSATDPRSTTSISTNMSYQIDPPAQNRLPANVSLPIDRPTSAQRSRTVAASAMTALSSNVPAPRAASQRLSTGPAGSSSTSHSYAPSYGTPLSNLIAPNPTAQPPSSADPGQPYRHQNARSQYSRASTGSAQSNISRNQQSISQHRNTYSSTLSAATPSSSSMYSEPSASQQHRMTGYDNTNAPHQPPTTSHAQNTASNPSYINSTSEYQPVNTSQSQSYQPATPGFIDPSQIYNPYYQEYQKTRVAEAEAEAERLKHPEAEKQKEVEKQREVERQKDIEKQNEPERRKRSARELEEMKKENLKRAAQAEISQKLAAAREIAASVRAANSQTAEKPKPGRKPGPKPRVQAPNPTDSAQGKSGGTQKKQQRRARKPQVEAPALAAPDESSGITHQTQSVPTAQPNEDQRQALSTMVQTPVEGQPDEDEDLEVKLMLEKMKELKSKYPNKFAKLLGGLEVSAPVAAPPQAVEERRTSGVLVSSPPPTSASMNPTEETNSMHDRGKFPAARRKRRSKPVNLAGHGAQSSPTRHDNGHPPQPPPAAASQPETNEKDQPTQMGGRMEIEKLIDSDESQPSPLPAPVQAAAPPAHPVPEPAAEAKQSQPASLPAQVQAAAPPNQPVPEPATGAKQTKEENLRAATIWPEPKRLALAQAASRYIDDVISNRNKGNKCPPEMVLSLIDRNPSYIELCGMLESRGYHLNRVHFAKHLLKAMPELTAGSSPAAGPNTVANGPSSTPRKGQMQPPPSTASMSPPIQYTGVRAGNNSTPIPLGSTARSGGPQVVGSKTAQPAPSSTPMPPPTNRDPGYFVPYQLPPSVPSENRVPGFIGSPPRQVGFSNGTQASRSAGPHSLPERLAPIRHTIGGLVPSPIGGKLKPKFRVPAPPAHIPAPGSKEALAKKRTFAEIVDFTQLPSDDDDDDSPPSKAPRLQDVPPQSDTNTDVDVEVPAPAPETPEAHSAPANTLDLSQFRMPDADSSTSNETLRGRSDIVKPLNKTEAVKTRYYDPKTIARDLLIATGRHPTERALNQHLSRLRDNFPAVDNSSDLRTFRWDIVDPGGPPPPEVPLVTAVSKPPLITVREYTRPGVADRLPNPHSRDSAKGTTGSQPPQTPSQLHISETINKSDDSSPHLRQESNNNINTESSVMSSTPQMPGTRRRGRPLGAKSKPRFADRVEIAIPISSSPNTPRTPFHMYKCEWKGCDAQLHNLQTLRKHATRLHVPRDTKMEAPCLWAGCRDGRNKFTRDSLADHLENKHLSALAWTLGEGPGSVRSGHRDYNIDDCLNDSNGRAVIARASAKGIRPTLILPAAYRSIRSFNKMYGNESDKAKALEVLRALEMKQVRVGTGLGRGGCTFMNEKRQETVVAFESIFEIVAEDDDGL